MLFRSDVVDGVMSFEERDAMMYKIEGEDLYLIGTSEHSMIGKFKDNLIDVNELPIKMTSYSPCFRKEKGAHGIEERGIYRIHQFEKQEMIVVCHPKDSEEWYTKMWNYTVELFRTLDIPVRTLECCSGDLADLKYESLDVEAWSPRQQKYFEVASCSNLTEAQSRRLGIRIKDGNKKYYAHTLNNTVIAPPRMLIAFVENNLNADGSLNIPEFKPKNKELIIEEPKEGDSNAKKLIVNYGEGTYGDGDNPIEISEAKRQIKVIIGGEATFLTRDGDNGKEYDVIFTEDLDKIEIGRAHV